MRKSHDLLLDKSAGTTSPDVVLQQARNERDEALKRYVAVSLVVSLAVLRIAIKI